MASLMSFVTASPQYRPRVLYFGLDAGANQTATVTTVADTGVFEVQRVTAPATAGATQADYFVVSNFAGETAAVWLDIDAAGTAPTGAAYVAADYQIEVNIVTGDTATQVAGKIVAAMGATLPDVTILDNADGTIDFTSDLFGNVTAPARHNANDSGNGSFVVATQTGGVASNLNNSYFLYDTPDNSYYFWFNVASIGVDPAISGKTGVAVAIAASAADTAVASALNTAMDAQTDITSTVLAAVVTAVNTEDGAVSVPADGTAATGFAFAVTQSGVSAGLNNGKFDATVTQSDPGVYVFVFDKEYARVPEVGALSKSDNRVPRISAIDRFGVTIEMQDLSGGAAADGGFSLIVLGSDAQDAIL